MPSRAAKTGVGVGGRPLGVKGGGEAGAHGKASNAQLDEDQMQVIFLTRPCCHSRRHQESPQHVPWLLHVVDYVHTAVVMLVATAAQSCLFL